MGEQEDGGAKSKVRYFSGDTSEEYRGVDGVGGWKRWVEMHIASWGSKVDEEARGTKLMNCITEGSEAERVLAHITVDMAKKADGIKKIFEAARGKGVINDMNTAVTRLAKLAEEQKDYGWKKM